MTNQHATITATFTTDHTPGEAARLLQEFLDAAEARGDLAQRGLHLQDDARVHVSRELAVAFLPLDVEVQGGVLVSIRDKTGLDLLEGEHYGLTDHDLLDQETSEVPPQPPRPPRKAGRLRLKARAAQIEAIKRGACPSCRARLEGVNLRSNVGFRLYQCPEDEGHLRTVVRATLIDQRGGSPLDIAIMEAREEAACTRCDAKLISACASPKKGVPPLRRPHPERVQAAHEARMWLAEPQTLRPYTPPVHGSAPPDCAPASIEKVVHAGLEAAYATWLINADLDGNPVPSRRAAKALMKGRALVLCLREVDPLDAGTPLYTLTRTHMEAALLEVAKQRGLPLAAFQAGCEEALADTILQHALFGRQVVA